MAFTTTQLAALEAALATGTLEVEYDGTRVKYHSPDALRKACDYVRSQLEAQGTTTPRKRTTYAAFDKD